jgi:hypothetical protein
MSWHLFHTWTAVQVKAVNLVSYHPETGQPLNADGFSSTLILFRCSVPGCVSLKVERIEGFWTLAEIKGDAPRNHTSSDLL